MTPSMSAKRPTIASSASSRRLCEVTVAVTSTRPVSPSESAVHLAEIQLRHGPDVLHELSADIGRARRPAFDRDDVMLLLLGHFHRLPIDGADQRPQDDVGRNHQNRRHEAVEPHPLAGEQADRGRAPKGRRGVEAAHIEALLEDHASAKKSDAGHDLGRHPRRAVRIRDRARHR